MKIFELRKASDYFSALIYNFTDVSVAKLA